MTFFEDETHERETFDQIDCEADMVEQTFYKCTFRNSSFQSRRLVECTFDECEFIQCNLSLMKNVGSVFTGVKFTDCKLLGVDWSSPGGFFSASYSGCIMENNAFTDMNLKKFTFTSCILTSSSFFNCQMQHAVFDDCDLAESQFYRTDLSFADFRSSRNYYMNVETNTLKQTRFSLPEAVSLLANLDIVVE